MDQDFESDSLELDLFFENSDPLATAQEIKSPVIPRGNLPRGNENSTNSTSPRIEKGAVHYHPHISKRTQERHLPLITPLNMTPSYKLASFQSYPSADHDVTTDTVFTHIVSDLNKILDSTDK